jgi:hypothetical protein
MKTIGSYQRDYVGKYRDKERSHAITKSSHAYSVYLLNKDKCA